MRQLFLVVAVVCFLIAAFATVDAPLIAIGLAAFAAAFLLSSDFPRVRR